MTSVGVVVPLLKTKPLDSDRLVSVTRQGRQQPARRCSKCCPGAGRRLVQAGGQMCLDLDEDYVV